MHRCCSAGVSWRLALIEFFSTPGPDGESPAELCGHQFKGILPMFSKVNEHDSDLFSERKEKEKRIFDAKTKQLPVWFIEPDLVEKSEYLLVIRSNCTVLKLHVHVLTFQSLY